MGDGVDEPTTNHPVNEIARVTPVHFVVEECCVCGESHRHGSAEDLDVGEYTDRGAHCSSFGHYWLKRTESTEVVE